MDVSDCQSARAFHFQKHFVVFISFVFPIRNKPTLQRRFPRSFRGAVQVDVPLNSKASDVKVIIAQELGMSPYTFKLSLGMS